MSASAGDGVCVDVAVLGVRLPLVSCFAAPALEHEQVLAIQVGLDTRRKGQYIKQLG